MRKYILISIILVCVFGCGNEGLEDKIKDLENENKDLGVKLQKQSTDMEFSTGVVKDVTSLLKNIQETEAKIEKKGTYYVIQLKWKVQLTWQKRY